MAELHEITYAVVRQDDGLFMVEITKMQAVEESTVIVHAFASEGEAQAWIEAERSTGEMSLTLDAMGGIENAGETEAKVA